MDSAPILRLRGEKLLPRATRGQRQDVSQSLAPELSSRLLLSRAHWFPLTSSRRETDREGETETYQILVGQQQTTRTWVLSSLTWRGVAWRGVAWRRAKPEASLAERRQRRQGKGSEREERSSQNVKSHLPKLRHVRRSVASESYPRA